MLWSFERALLAAVCLVAVAGCSSGTAAPSSTASDAGAVNRGAISSCDPGQLLVGATYDVRKSRFAFGSTPQPETMSLGTRYVGDHGTLLVQANGSAMGVLNATAPERALPGWSGDTPALQRHAVEYFGAMGVDACQVGSTGVNSTMAGGGATGADGGAGGMPSGAPTMVAQTITLQRAVDGIRVSESIAYADFRGGDVTVSEALYWPAIPEDVVTSARTFRDRLKDPAQLAAYRAKLPVDAQSGGEVTIAHSSSVSSKPFRAQAVWSVTVNRGTALFDEDGARVDGPNA